MIALRILTSVLLLGLAAVSLPLLVYGDSMAAFGPGRHEPNPARVVTVTCLLALLPTIAIWIPRRTALVIGGLILLPSTVIGLILIFALPLAGLAMTAIYGLWYFTAISIWRHFPPIQIVQSRIENKSPEEY
jgi:hypothetical protein